MGKWILLVSNIFQLTRNSSTMPSPAVTTFKEIQHHTKHPGDHGAQQHPCLLQALNNRELAHANSRDRCGWPRIHSSPGTSETIWHVIPSTEGRNPPARGAGTLIPSAQRLVWAAKQPLGNAALGALFSS